MVHRVPDARLLTNLIANEKEYARQLNTLFPLSHAALASLSAYAAASPASPARTIAAVVDLLASADDALQRYNVAIDTWREQLVSLKSLEDDLAAVLRDRDILVTRLIKASKATRDAHRSSRLMSTLGSASLSSLPSTNSTTTHYSPSSSNPTTIIGGGSSPASTNAKLAQAQAELQACEAHLVAKERELDARRISVARDGLGARCRALIDCGWVWGETGKQGLRTLQALTADAPTPNGSKPANSTYASDNSSLTPSQSASQTAARSAETSHEGSASKEHEHTTSEGPDAQGDLTLTLPPAHAISEFTFPTSVRSLPSESGGTTAQEQDTVVQASKTATPAATPLSAPASKRRRTKRRPPSHYIVEVTDEGSDTGPFPPPTNAPTTTATTTTTTTVIASSSTNTNTGHADPHAPISPFPTTGAPNGARDNSSDDEPAGSFQIVENDPYEVIRRSMLGTSPSVPLLPVPPGAHDGLSGSETNPPKATLLVGRSAGGGSKRERRTSMAFFGSLKGLFRRPKDRERTAAALDWDDSTSPRKSSVNLHTNGHGQHGRGWVTRTDARIAKGGQGGQGRDSDDDLGRGGNVVRGSSGGRLRKGRQRGTAEAGALGVDGWITDSPQLPGATGPGASTSGIGLDKVRTRRGMMKRRKTSVADLRGSEQGHTDGEVEERTGRSLTRASTSAMGKKGKDEGNKAEEATIEGASGKVGRRTSAPASKGVSGDVVKPHAEPNVQHGRAATTSGGGSSRQLSEAHRRSASLSVVEADLTVESSGTTWRKPTSSPSPSPYPASSESSAARVASRTPSPPITPSPTPPPMSTRPSVEVHKKTQGRRSVGNGHAVHGHTPSQSLMSIVADVTRLDWEEGEKAGTRSLDVPRAPGSVLREVGKDGDRDREVGSRGGSGGGSGRGYGRRASWTVGVSESRIVDHGQTQGQKTTQGQGRGRGMIKLPLRSALRNASRTPSPSPGGLPMRVENGGDKKAPVGTVKVDERERERAFSPSSFRDSMSVSSYATGRESLGDEPEGGDETARPEPLLTIPPPPARDPPATTDESSKTEMLVRRKSVRVSLQPTFSSTPPALVEDDERDGYGWTRRDRQKTTTSDVWADSSSEDEVYQRGRALLSLVGGGSVSKGSSSKGRHTRRSS